MAGIAQTEAKKSSDLFAKCQYLDELTGGRGVVFATGTPISNSCLLYTSIGNHRYGYCNRGNGTVEFWRGGYLSARAKTTLTLLEVAERAAQLIEQGTYRREAPPAAFPIVEDAREEQADGTEAPKTARAGFSEAEINAVLCHGSGFSKGKFRIAEWYGGKHTEKETADFLKHEYLSLIHI